MPLIDVVIEDERWVELDGMAGVACRAALDELGLKGAYEICIMACDDRRIAELNTEFRGKPTATNVLSWPSEERAVLAPGEMPQMPEMPGELGDIAIAFETCEREAQAQGLNFADHCTHLLVHGTLHLLGFDHENDQDAQLMEGLESRILAKLGISDPYGE